MNVELPPSLYVVAFQVGITAASTVGAFSAIPRLPLIGAALALVGASVTLTNRQAFA